MLSRRDFFAIFLMMLTVFFIFQFSLVMKAAGIGPWSCAKAAMLIGFLLSVFNLYINNVVIPKAEQEFARLEWQVKNDMSHLMFKEGEFTTVQTYMTIFVASHDGKGTLSGILVNDERDANKKITISAEKGKIVYSSTPPRLILINGVRNEITKDEKQQFSSLAFDRYSVDFGISDKTKEKEVGARELTLKELLLSYKNKGLTQQQINRYMVEGFRRILMPLYCFVYALIACTGLLVSNFNRRGQGRIITYSILFMVIVQACDLAFGNLTMKKLVYAPLMGLNFIVPFFTCFYLLVFYNPARKRKKVFDKGLVNV